MHFFLPSSLLFLLAFLCSQTLYAESKFERAYEATQKGDYQYALQLWKPLAQQGIPAAQYTLGWIYESGQGVSPNYQRAAYWYRQAAEQGEIAAQYVLATMYDDGKGVALNQAQAVHWFLKAANQGDAIAQYQLAMHLQKGEGIKQDSSKSLFWYNQAAKQGYLCAQVNLGKIYQTSKNYRLALHWYKKAAARNNAQAQFHLAMMYEQGQGTQQNDLQALSLYLKSAKNHYAPAAYRVAEFYRQGKSTKTDFQEALKWYQQAANKGYPDAQFKLGEIYENGKITTQNIDNAIIWYKRAAQQDHAQAAYQLATIYDNAKKNKINEKNDYQQAAQYYESAHRLGYHQADARLAFLYEKGLGVAIDIKRAIYLYQQSSQAWAQARLKILLQQQDCLQNATTKLFSVAIACASRQQLQQEIKARQIPLIEAKSNSQSDTYFTGAAVAGSSELTIRYTPEQHFASARYTFIGRDNPELISRIKTQLSKKYGAPDNQSGDLQQGKVSLHWLLDDNIELTVARDWPDTTTFVTYALATHLALIKNKQIASE